MANSPSRRRAYGAVVAVAAVAVSVPAKAVWVAGWWHRLGGTAGSHVGVGQGVSVGTGVSDGRGVSLGLGGSGG